MTEGRLDSELDALEHHVDRVAVEPELERRAEPRDGIALGVGEAVARGIVRIVEEQELRARERGVEPNAISYNSAIEACAKRGDGSAAEARALYSGAMAVAGWADRKSVV